MKKKWLVIVVIVLSASYILYNYIYKDHRDIATETAAFEISSNKITSDFRANNQKAQIKYLNKTLIISGIISSSDETSVTLDETIYCNLSNYADTDMPASGDSISIKGRCIGYDDLLDEIKLDQCSIIN